MRSPDEIANDYHTRPPEDEPEPSKHWTETEQCEAWLDELAIVCDWTNPDSPHAALSEAIEVMVLGYEGSPLKRYHTPEIRLLWESGMRASEADHKRYLERWRRDQEEV